jgi:diadenosine tetraphosphate (Ap4A) HIT family hydrolase
MTKPSNCKFCSIVNRKSGLWYDEILLESKNFCIVPALGPISLGHYLLISKSHQVSFSHLPPMVLREGQRELNKILKIKILSGLHPLEFEHGSSSGDCAGSCINHAHLHIVFTENESIGKIKPVGALSKLEKLRSPESLKGIPYLYWSDPRNRHQTSSYLQAHDVGRQEMRRSVCRASDRRHWNWEKVQNLKLLKDNIKIFKSHTWR